MTKKTKEKGQRLKKKKYKKCKNLKDENKDKVQQLK